eukprot:Selendium_serpulae@DN6016_c0_g1_i1.p1
MSDVDIDTEEAPQVAEVETVTDLKSAVRVVLKKALIHDGVKRGIHEVAKALEADVAHCCFLSESCSEDAYKKLVKGLCAEHKIPLIDVAESKDLGQWAGLCKMDKEGNPRKIVGASAVCITDYGEESEGLSFLKKHFKEIQVGEQ